MFTPRPRVPHHQYRISPSEVGLSNKDGGVFSGTPTYQRSGDDLPPVDVITALPQGNHGDEEKRDAEKKDGTLVSDSNFGTWLIREGREL